MHDAILVGSGPNGLSAAIRLAQAGLSVLVLEAAPTPGGGLRSAELTAPGFTHDVCSAIHPLALASPFLRTLPLAQYGLSWVQPEVPVAHAFTPDTPLLLHRDLDAAAQGFGRDAAAYRRVMAPFVHSWQGVMEDFLGPLPVPPRHPIVMARFGLAALQSATGLARRSFRTEAARAAFAGLAAHAMMPLEWVSMAGFGLMLGVLAHAVGWPLARGGSQRIADAMVAHLQSLGGEIRTGHKVSSLADLPPSKLLLFDTSVRSLRSIAGDRLDPGYDRQLSKYRYGGGVCKVDWALSEPVPWANPDYARAATVHIGGTLAEIALSERAIWQGKVAEKPYVLFVQHSLFDETRAPQNGHTAWAYCHVPADSDGNYADLIEAQVERFAPGFRDTVIARSVRTAQEMEAYNSNYVGGDINGGVQDLRQLFTRPVVRWNPYRVPGRFDGRRAYLCSSATPPGGGVHGMCGYFAAQTALKDLGAPILAA